MKKKEIRSLRNMTKIWTPERISKKKKNPLKCKHAFVLIDSDALPTCTECGFDQLEIKSMEDEEIKYIAKEVAKEYSEKVIAEREKKALELEAERLKIIAEMETKYAKSTWVCKHNKTHLNKRGRPTCDSCGKIVKLTTISSKPLLIGRPASRMSLPPAAAFTPSFKVGDMVRIKKTLQVGQIRAVTPVTASRVGMVYAYEVEIYDKESKRYVGAANYRDDEIESNTGTLEKTPRKRRIANKTQKHLSKLVISDNEITFS